MRAGRKVMVWTQTYNRNEPLDCRNYATAAMELLMPDFESLAKVEIGAPPAAPAQGRRMVSRGIG